MSKRNGLVKNEPKIKTGKVKAGNLVAVSVATAEVSPTRVSGRTRGFGWMSILPKMVALAKGATAEDPSSNAATINFFMLTSCKLLECGRHHRWPGPIRQTFF